MSLSLILIIISNCRKSDNAYIQYYFEIRSGSIIDTLLIQEYNLNNTLEKEMVFTETYTKAIFYNEREEIDSTHINLRYNDSSYVIKFKKDYYKNNLIKIYSIINKDTIGKTNLAYSKDSVFKVIEQGDKISKELKLYHDHKLRSFAIYSSNDKHFNINYFDSLIYKELYFYKYNSDRYSKVISFRPKIDSAIELYNYKGKVLKKIKELDYNNSSTIPEDTNTIKVVRKPV